jgi:hypothetical protein
MMDDIKETIIVIVLPFLVVSSEQRNVHQLPRDRREITSLPKE